MSTRLIAIGICTFRRAALAKTLASIERQIRPENTALLIIVADNDDIPSARQRVRDFAAGSAHEVEYVHAPARNISIARNAILDAAARAGAVRLAMIDDDEIAAPDWLARLDAAMTQDGADAAIGPVRAVYAKDAPRWMQAAQVHDTWPETGDDGRPLAGHSCNVMIDCTAQPFAGLRFDPARGQSGGEDTAWFEAARRAGARLTFAGDAWVSEDVPDARATLRWLAKRRYRMGQTHASLHYAELPVRDRWRQFAASLAKVAWCMAAAAVQLPYARARNGNIVRAALHVGVMSTLLGLRQVRIYGAPAPRRTGGAPQITRTMSKGADRNE